MSGFIDANDYIDDMAMDIEAEEEIMDEMDEPDEYEPDNFVTTKGVTTDQKQRDFHSRNELRQRQLAEDDAKLESDFLQRLQLTREQERRESSQEKRSLPQATERKKVCILCPSHCPSFISQSHTFTHHSAISAELSSGSSRGPQRTQRLWWWCSPVSRGRSPPGHNS